MFAKLRYKLWLLCGGRRTESGFKFLSKDIIENRKLISELHSEIRDLKSRVWELEEHPIEETLEELHTRVTGFADLAAALQEREAR